MRAVLADEGKFGDVVAASDASGQAIMRSGYQIGQM
jgi:hypothetical protein